MFRFNHIFDPLSTTEQIFDSVIRPKLAASRTQDLLVFAYGITGSGKTFTMCGSQDNLGFIPRVVRQILDTNRQGDKAAGSAEVPSVDNVGLC